MSELKKYLIYIFWALATGFLIFLSIGYNDPDSSILAQVEPQKFAVSYQRAVRVKEFFVIPGQQVKKGDRLVKVERPDLVLDVESKMTRLGALSSRLEVLEVEKENNRAREKMSYDWRNEELNAELERINLLISSNKNVSENLQAMNIWNDSIYGGDQNYLEIKAKLLEGEKKSLTRQYRLKMDEVNKVYALETSATQKQIEFLQKEIDQLKEEEKELIQYAHEDGTVGNIYVETEELVSPYTVLLSLYALNPTVIKALMHENQSNEVKIGDQVIVESTNRKYKVTGEVKEIGARIVEYPDRLKTFRELQMYGRELFIQIPEDSEFLNGEKVFVSIP